MLATIGAASIDDLYADIPPSLRLGRPLDLPAPLRSEAELARHVEGAARPQHLHPRGPELPRRGLLPAPRPGGLRRDQRPGRVPDRLRRRSVRGPRPLPGAVRVRLDDGRAPGDGRRERADLRRVPGRRDGAPHGRPASRAGRRVLIPALDEPRQAVADPRLRHPGPRGRRDRDATARRPCWTSARWRRHSPPTSPRSSSRTPPSSAAWRRSSPEIVRLAHAAGALVDRAAWTRRRSASWRRPPPGARTSPAATSSRWACTSSSAAATAASSPPRTTPGSWPSSRRACSASPRRASPASTASATWPTSGPHSRVREEGKEWVGHGRGAVGDHGRRLPRPDGPAGDARAGRDDDGPHALRDDPARARSPASASRSPDSTTSRSSCWT